MIKKYWSKLIRWFKLTFMNFYDPYFKSKDGMLYARMPNGMILRLGRKKDIKMQKKKDELRDFFKRKEPK